MLQNKNSKDRYGTEEHEIWKTNYYHIVNSGTKKLENFFMSFIWEIWIYLQCYAIRWWTLLQYDILVESHEKFAIGKHTSNILFFNSIIILVSQYNNSNNIVYPL